MSSVRGFVSPSPARALVEPKGDPKATASGYIREPLEYSGSLDGFKSFDKVRDLAITVSRRGVVFFRNQRINSDEQKVLGQRLGELTGKPATSKLHRHAVNNAGRKLTVNEHGKLDDEISVISSETNRKYYGDRFAHNTRHLASEGWHADLRQTFAPPIQALADTLTAVHHQPSFNNIAKEHGIELIHGERGAPENTGYDFKASHPLVRTNPVTGWKSLFGAAGQVDNGWIDGVTERESELLKKSFRQLIAENHGLQVRFKWGTNDVAIWDNRSVFHTATNDCSGRRQGNRVVSLGEIPYFDPACKSRRQALAAEA
ncbi:hypothetical protein BDW66DRAFT_156749 [Aspergillus desertorum]